MTWRNLYHIQWKFRDEVRPLGVMRGREFLMKDNYSFDIDKKGAIHSYNKMFDHLRTFARMGLKAIPMRAETGPIGGDLSHEFIVLADTGESRSGHKGLVDKDILSRKIDYRSDLQPIVNDGRRSTPRPTTCTTRQPSRRSPSPSGFLRAASRSAISSTSAPRIRRP